jgi:hypothetical protein
METQEQAQNLPQEQNRQDDEQLGNTQSRLGNESESGLNDGARNGEESEAGGGGGTDLDDELVGQGEETDTGRETDLNEEDLDDQQV